MFKGLRFKGLRVSGLRVCCAFRPKCRGGLSVGVWGFGRRGFGLPFRFAWQAEGLGFWGLGGPALRALEKDCKAARLVF